MNWSIKRTLWGDRMVTEQDQVVGSTRRGLFSTRVLNASGTLLWCVRTCPLSGGITVNQQKLDVRYKNEVDFFLPRKLENVEAEVDAVQTHNAQDAIKSAWGVDVSVDSNGNLTLLQ